MLLLWILQLATAIVSVWSCSVPAALRGVYYAEGQAEERLEITETSVTGRGSCSMSRDNLLVFRDGSSFTCMLVFQRHTNVIEYKENRVNLSSASPPSLESLCLFGVDARFLTLIREDISPIPCPSDISRPYSFGYDNGSGDCYSPESSWTPCTKPGTLQVRWRRCPGIMHTFDREERLECIATWRRDMKDYVFARFPDRPTEDKRKMYRCMVYSKQNDLNVGMSGGPLCRGVDAGPHSASIIILAKPHGDWPKPACQLLSGVTEDQQWRTRSTDGATYRLRDKGRVLEEVGRGGEVRLVHRCMASASAHHNEHNTVFSNEGCGEPVYRCLRLRSRTDGVLELRLGAPVSSFDKEACSQERVEEAEAVTLFDESISESSIPCPHPGHRTGTWHLASCSSTPEWSSQCEDKHHMNVTSACSHATEKERCVKTWTAHGRHFLVTSSHDRRHLNCYSFKKHSAAPGAMGQEPRLRLEPHPGCLFTLHDASGQHVPYLTFPLTGKCQKKSSTHISGASLATASSLLLLLALSSSHLSLFS